MTRDEILDEYEALWRQAMVEGKAQGRAPVGQVGDIEGGDCAWTTARGQHECFSDQARNHRIAWRCSCDHEAHWLHRVMIHLNDAHGWTWDMFANKFRDALAQGETS